MTKKSTLNASDVSLLIGAMKVVFPTRTDVETIIDEKLDEKIGKLPTKEEFFDRMDKLSVEYKKIDEAETLHAGSLSEQEEKLESYESRIKALENRHTSIPTPIVSTL